MSELWRRSKETTVVDDNEDDDYNDNDDEPVPGVDVVLSSGNSSEVEDDDDNEDENGDYGLLMSPVATRPLRSTPPKWKVNMSPRPVMSNHSWIGLSGAASSSRICLSAKSSCASTTSLVKKILNSSQDIQISVSEDKLKALYQIIMASFERRKKVDFNNFYSNSNLT